MHCGATVTEMCNIPVIALRLANRGSRTPIPRADSAHSQICLLATERESERGRGREGEREGEREGRERGREILGRQNIWILLALLDVPLRW